MKCKLRLGLRQAHSSAPKRLANGPFEIRDWSATVATASTSETEPTILLRFNDSKYIFNAGDNTTRAFLQYSPTSTRMRAVFLTRVAAETIGGLGGAIAHIAKTVHSLTVVGPPGIRHFVASLRGFIRGVLGFSLIEYQPKTRHGKLDTIYKDENITVSAFPVTSTPIADGVSEEEVEVADAESPHISRAKTSAGLTADEVRQAAVYHMFKRNSANIRPEFLEGEAISDDRERWIPNWLHEKQLPSFSFPKTYPQSSTLGYVVIGPRPQWSTARKFNGRDSHPCPVVIILDVPSPDFIPSILQSFDNECAPFLKGDPNSNANYNTKAVYHILGPQISRDFRYIEFLQSFPKHTKHFISCPDMSPDFFMFPHNAWRLYQLCRLDSETFPSLRQRTLKPFVGSLAGLKTAEMMRPGLQIRLDEDAFVRGSLVYNFGSRTQTQSSILHHMLVPDEVFRTFRVAQKIVACHPDNKRTNKRISAKVICLGTGKLPNQFRNVISTLLLTPDGHIMLDCGEGTMQQLLRREGYAWHHYVRNIKCIFISHAHADHHLGLISLLRRRKDLKSPPTQPLYIVATRLVHLFLKEYQELEDIGLCDDPAQNGVIQIISDALNYRHDEYLKSGPWRMLGTEPWLDLQLSRQHNLDMCKHLNLASFETIDVRHNTRAFGSLIRHNDGWSVTYSGDTQPTMNLVRLGTGTNLLIHEATHPFGEEALASKRGHTTVGQAIMVGRDMFARNVLLTHLRWTAVRLPSVQHAQWGENTDEWLGPVVGVANDFMGIDLDKFWKANIYATAIAHCHKASVAIEQKSIAELLLDLFPEESLVCCPDIYCWPWNRAFEGGSDYRYWKRVCRTRDEVRSFVRELLDSPM